MDVNTRRSQAILRMPIDPIEVELILHDGDRSAALMFVPPTSQVHEVLCDTAPFLAVARAGAEVLVSRSAIACVGLPAARGPRLDPELAHVAQRVLVRLRSGIVVDGELRWVAPPGRQRTSDHLNADVPYLAVYDGATTYLVLKAHIATVTER